MGQDKVFTPVCHSVQGGGLASQHTLGWGGGLATQHALGRGVGYPACTGEGGWLPSMHWEEGLASQHAPELGKAGGMNPTGMLSCCH